MSIWALPQGSIHMLQGWNRGHQSKKSRVGGVYAVVVTKELCEMMMMSPKMARLLDSAVIIPTTLRSGTSTNCTVSCVLHFINELHITNEQLLSTGTSGMSVWTRDIEGICTRWYNIWDPVISTRQGANDVTPKRLFQMCQMRCKALYLINLSSAFTLGYTGNRIHLNTVYLTLTHHSSFCIITGQPNSIRDQGLACHLESPMKLFRDFVL